jgi:hypothetical protein
VKQAFSYSPSKDLEIKSSLLLGTPLNILFCYRQILDLDLSTKVHRLELSWTALRNTTLEVNKLSVYAHNVFSHCFVGTAYFQELEDDYSLPRPLLRMGQVFWVVGLY